MKENCKREIKSLYNKVYEEVEKWASPHNPFGSSSTVHVADPKRLQEEICHGLFLNGKLVGRLETTLLKMNEPKKLLWSGVSEELRAVLSYSFMFVQSF